jgi:aromatic-amino-acid transaminase
MEGLLEFRTGARNLLFGHESEPVVNQRIATVQSISGSGALGIGFDFIAKYLPRIVYISNPTWAIHRIIIEKQHLKVI